MLDKVEVKGYFPIYSLDAHCILEYTGKDKFSGGRIHNLLIPNLDKTEFLEARIVERSTGHKVKIEGNLRKWMYGSRSAVGDLNYKDFEFCIGLIAKRLGVEKKWIWNLEITYVEMGGNIRLPRAYERFIPSLISYPELTMERWTESTVYFKGAKYSLIFYDKLKQLKNINVVSSKVADKIIKKWFILRFEIKVNAKSGYRKKEYIQTFLTIRKNWGFLLDDWFLTFQKAKAIDLFSDSIEIKKGSLTKRETFDYGNFLLANEVGIDRSLYFFQYFMKDRKNEAVDYFQHLFKTYKTGENWNFYENILAEVKAKSEKMKKGSLTLDYNNKKTTTKTVDTLNYTSN